MPDTPTTELSTSRPIRGTIIEAEIKQVVDPTRALPLVTAVYAIETEEGFWLCSYYGSNRSNFDYLPQKGSAVDESKLGMVFHSRELVPRERYEPARWEGFKRLHIPGGHGAHSTVEGQRRRPNQRTPGVFIFVFIDFGQRIQPLDTHLESHGQALPA